MCMHLHVCASYRGQSLKLFCSTILHVILCVCAPKHACGDKQTTYCGQLTRVSFLLLSCRSQGSNSSSQALWQAPLTTKPPCQLSTLFFEMGGLSLNLELTDSARCLIFPVLGLQVCATTLGLYRGARDLNSGPHVCMASTLPPAYLHHVPSSLAIKPS